MTEHAVRPARARDLDQLSMIEDSGLDLFESAWGDLSDSPLSSPAPSGRERAAAPGFLLVAGDPVVGFAHVALHDGHAHLEQLSVAPQCRRTGLGTALLEAACERLQVLGHGTLTLLTYADLPWNAPFYARHGFVEVAESDPRAQWQRVLLDREAELGLDRHGRRVLMRRPLRRHRTTEELTAYLPTLDATPQDAGTLKLLVRRPAPGTREVLEEGELDLAVGLVGDSWSTRGSRRTPSNNPSPDMQLNVMSHPMIEFLAQDPAREPLAGDQLYLDLDLSHQNLPAGTRLRIADPDERGAVIEVTAHPHNGCAKFIGRFGKDAMAFVNGPAGKPRRLRGLCAKVVVPGRVRPGDPVRVERTEPVARM